MTQSKPVTRTLTLFALSMTITSCAAQKDNDGVVAGSKYQPTEAKYKIADSGVTCHKQNHESFYTKDAVETKVCTWYCASNYDNQFVDLFFEKGQNGWEFTDANTNPSTFCE